MRSPLLGVVIQVWSMNIGGSKLLLVHDSLLKLFLPSGFASKSNCVTSRFLIRQFRCCPTHLAHTSYTPVMRQPQCSWGGKKTKSFTIVGEIPAQNALPPTPPKPRRWFLPLLALLTSQPSGTTQVPPSWESFSWPSPTLLSQALTASCNRPSWPLPQPRLRPQWQSTFAELSDSTISFPHRLSIVWRRKLPSSSPVFT